LVRGLGFLTTPLMNIYALRLLPKGQGEKWLSLLLERKRLEEEAKIEALRRRETERASSAVTGRQVLGGF
jgi:hypothetical protein